MRSNMNMLTNPGTNARTERNRAIRGIQGSAELLIYAVRTKDDLIKIGASADLVTRLDHIKGGTAELLAMKPGTRADEREIHQSLTGHAAEGREYYLPTPSVIKVVNAMRAPLGLEPYTPARCWA